MSETTPQGESPLSPGEVERYALDFHTAITDAADALMTLGHHKQISPTQIVLGGNRNFLNIMGIGTDKIHLVIGKTPIESGHSHRHRDVVHLLHIGHETHVGEEQEPENDDPNAFESWEAVVTIGDQSRVVYASHEWKTGMAKDGEGKEKKGIVLTSPSNGIQTNTHEAVTGIQNMLPHIQPPK